jgi:4-hydroxy-3-methylbut-2-enyl diphosphate reductase
LVNQSTTPQLLADEIKTILMKTNPNLQYVNTTCKVMSTRFDNIRKLKDVDYLIIIGDSKSNNTNQLINLAKHYQIKHQLITDISDIKPNSFKNVKNLSITSGTSVDPKHVQTIIKKIKTTIK